jgi:hypothetical protein
MSLLSSAPRAGSVLDNAKVHPTKLAGRIEARLQDKKIS